MRNHESHDKWGTKQKFSNQASQQRVEDAMTLHERQNHHHEDIPHDHGNLDNSKGNEDLMSSPLHDPFILIKTCFINPLGLSA